MNSQIVYLLENLDSGKREMLAKYLRECGTIQREITELNERHTAYFIAHFREVMLHAKAYFHPEETFHEIATEALGGDL